MENINLNEATIVDVREPLELLLGKIEGAINIPLGKVPDNLEKFKTLKKPLVLCCQSGNRSGQAVEFLAANGIENIHNGGGWKQVKNQL